MNDLAKELHKQKRTNFSRRQVRSAGIDKIWSADLVDMFSFSKSNDGTKFILTVIDIFTKFAWAIPLPNKQGKTVTEAFDKIIRDSGRKPEHLWVDKGAEFYNRTLKLWLTKNEIEMYSTSNAGKAVVIERFNRTLKSWMWKYFTSHSTNKYIDVLDKLLHAYNNRIHRTIKMTPHEASEKKNEQLAYDNTYQARAPSDRFSKFQIGDRVRAVKLKRRFEKGYTPNWTEEVFEIDNVLPTKPLTYVIRDLAGNRINGSYYEQELQHTSQDVFRIENVIRKDNKKKQALVKWKGYSEKFNSWVPFEDLEKL